MTYIEDSIVSVNRLKSTFYRKRLCFQEKKTERTVSPKLPNKALWFDSWILTPFALICQNLTLKTLWKLVTLKIELYKTPTMLLWGLWLWNFFKEFNPIHCHEFLFKNSLCCRIQPLSKIAQIIIKTEDPSAQALAISKLKFGQNLAKLHRFEALGGVG